MDIGSTLREARMRARIDITEVESRTKIRAKYLRAIENEEWDLLPGPVYIKSFLRTYGDYLGLDSRMLIDDFKRRYERPADHDMRPISSLSRERERRPRRRPVLPPWAPIAVVIVAVVVLLAVIGALSSGGKNGSPASLGAGSRHRPKPPVQHHVRTVPAAPPAKATLQLTPTGTVYVCLVNGRGRKLINEQTFGAGQRVPAESARRLLLTLGNNAVGITVNGRPVRVAASANAIRLLITPGGARQIPISTKPTCP